MAIFDAAAKGHLERVRAMVEQDAGLVHATDDHGCTPLHHAASNRHVEVTRYLLDHGAAVNHRDNTGYTALLEACRTRQIGIVLLLLERGADVTAASDDGTTPLMFCGNAVARTLLKHGSIDVDAADDEYGWTACHYACNGSEADFLRRLLKAGADPTLRDLNGLTAKEVVFDPDEGEEGEECVTTVEEWERVYLLQRARRVRDASSTASSSAL